jgi:proteasome assembly chaperone (PAC2) family protein
MAEVPALTRPWLVAVWPGMGQVALSAGYYLMAKLDMRLLAEMDAHELFDMDDVVVKNGLIKQGQIPRNRFFVWNDPDRRHDIVVFIGEAQPPLGKYTFCQRLVAYAQELGVERIFTFAAMATPMTPNARSRVFCSATEERLRDELVNNHLEVLKEGQISGLNGVLLAAAQQARIAGACLLGEMPHVFHRLPFPKASLAVLNAFKTIARIEVDLEELSTQSRAVTEQLAEIYSQVSESIEQSSEEQEESPEIGTTEPAEPKIPPEVEQRIERLFEESRQDRSKAYLLKQELDRLGLFQEFEDRFLDLFKRPDETPGH